MRLNIRKAMWCAAVLAMSALPASAAKIHHSCIGPAFVCNDSAPAVQTGKKGKVAAAKARRHKSVESVAVAYAGGGQSGLASWYGGSFHGRRTASGEVFNQNAMTAAHKTLPFGTRVQVTNTRSGNSVVVRINDRGPFVKGRVIDLSRAAASQLGVGGVAPVRLTVLGRG